MTTLTALLCAFVRLLRPADGVHSDPSGYLRAVLGEVRRRSRRVRRYAADLPTVAVADDVPRPPVPSGVLSTAHVPTDYVVVVDPAAVRAPAAMVRGPYLAYEQQCMVDDQPLAA